MARGLLGPEFAGGIVDATAFFDSDIPKLTGELLQMGVLVAFGTTRDRGAVSITVTNDGDWDRSYFRDSADAADWLRRATAVLRVRGLGNLAPEGPAIPAPTRRRQKLS